MIIERSQYAMKHRLLAKEPFPKNVFINSKATRSWIHELTLKESSEKENSGTLIIEPKS